MGEGTVFISHCFCFILRHMSKSQPSWRRGGCCCLCCPDSTTANTCRQFLLPSSGRQLTFILSSVPVGWGWKKAQGFSKEKQLIWNCVVVKLWEGTLPYSGKQSHESDGWRVNHEIPLKLKGSTPGCYTWKSVLNFTKRKSISIFQIDLYFSCKRISKLN